MAAGVTLLDSGLVTSIQAYLESELKFTYRGDVEKRRAIAKLKHTFADNIDTNKGEITAQAFATAIIEYAIMQRYTSGAPRSLKNLEKYDVTVGGIRQSLLDYLNNIFMDSAKNINSVEYIIPSEVIETVKTYIIAEHRYFFPGNKEEDIPIIGKSQEEIKSIRLYGLARLFLDSEKYKTLDAKILAKQVLDYAEMHTNLVTLIAPESATRLRYKEVHSGLWEALHALAASAPVATVAAAAPVATVAAAGGAGGSSSHSAPTDSAPARIATTAIAAAGGGSGSSVPARGGAGVSGFATALAMRAGLMKDPRKEAAKRDADAVAAEEKGL